MRRPLIAMLGLLIGLMPLAASAGLDNKTDSFGIYFDAAGNSNGIPAQGPFVPFNVYLLLMNPAGPSNGFECTVTPVGAPYFALSTTLGGTGALDVDSSANGFAVGVASNYVPNSGAIVLVTYSFMLQAAAPLDFYISQASIPSMPGGLPVVTGDGVLRRGAVSSCDVGLPVARVNGSAPPICNDPPILSSLVVDINASASGAQDSQIRAATLPAATDGYDGGIDIPKPTPPPGNYVTASFEHPDWTMGPRFGADIRARFDPLVDFQVWPLMVETDRPGDITLAFTPDFNAASGTLLYLRDLQTGQFYNLFPSLTYVFSNNGLPNTRRYELIVGAAPVPPALSPENRVLSTGWSMVGLPLSPAAGATVGALLLDPAPGYAFAYDYAGSAGYRNLPAATAAVQGKGYWLATDAAFSWSTPGARDLDGVSVNLINGWNLVGNANWFPGPVEGLRVIQNGNSYDWQAASQMGLVSPDVQTFDAVSGDYVDAVDLQPWHGYWINALQSNLTLFFYWGNFVELPKRLTAQKSLLDPDDPSWQSDLTLQDAADQVRTITLGRHTGATAGFDPLCDRPQPPQPPAGGPLLMFNRPEWELAAGGAMSRDLVGMDDEGASWTVVLSSPNPGRAVLSWKPAEWPDGVDFQLYLPDENRVAVMSMRSQTSITFPLGAMARQVVVRTPDMTSSVDSPPAVGFGLSVQPNPFNPQTTVAFDLPDAARAEVRIYSVRGELVAVLGGGSYAAGRHQEMWRGVDRQGRDAPSGSYFARLYVEGKARGAVSKMSLVR